MEDKSEDKRIPVYASEDNGNELERREYSNCGWILGFIQPPYTNKRPYAQRSTKPPEIERD